jgi:hypothetical protein
VVPALDATPCLLGIPGCKVALNLVGYVCLPLNVVHFERLLNTLAKYSAILLGESTALPHTSVAVNQSPS